MSEEDRGYDLPTPDMSVFGAPSDDPPTERHESGPTGTMRFQDQHTSPRPPSLAEQRARRDAEDEIAAAQALAAGKAAGRRRVMIGAGVTVGVAALVGAWYLLATPATVSAQCTVAGAGSDADTIVADQNCDPDYANAHGGHVSNGFVFLPLPGGGFRQYHYYYYGGPPGAIGSRATGGSFSAPSNATVKTPSGKTVQRGGFGFTGKSGGSGTGGGEEGGGGRSGGS